MSKRKQPTLVQLREELEKLRLWFLRQWDRDYQVVRSTEHLTEGVLNIRSRRILLQATAVLAEAWIEEESQRNPAYMKIPICLSDVEEVPDEQA